ncbi:MAG: hypothetical protein M0C28_23100 [Candidatus Moduliflexus flocculans]|nr:hypothetical protein [Candidatus Moduliflexus flocculans]
MARSRPRHAVAGPTPGDRADPLPRDSPADSSPSRQPGRSPTAAPGRAASRWPRRPPPAPPSASRGRASPADSPGDRSFCQSLAVSGVRRRATGSHAVDAEASEARASPPPRAPIRRRPALAADDRFMVGQADRAAAEDTERRRSPRARPGSCLPRALRGECRPRRSWRSSAPATPRRRSRAAGFSWKAPTQLATPSTRAEGAARRAVRRRLAVVQGCSARPSVKASLPTSAASRVRRMSGAPACERRRPASPRASRPSATWRLRHRRYRCNSAVWPRSTTTWRQRGHDGVVLPLTRQSPAGGPCARAVDDVTSDASQGAATPARQGRGWTSGRAAERGANRDARAAAS